ncbi:MAG TPA: isoprenylcysteine carboxylmethyltransferase family protein [Anaerolineaceae bacterium]|nr:isoprenylcysteine carboxylmethyltransferase family protein [Anaerolineaceae bacterium]
MSDTTNTQTPKLDRSGINRIIQVLGSLLVFGVILFAAAGRLDWWDAWIFLGIYLAGVLINGLWSIRHNPEMINERGRIGANAKSWDKVIGIFYLIFLIGIYVVAGLDERFNWSMAPLWVKLLGGIAFALSMALTFWVMKTNTFLSTFVRIQDDRGHTTVTSGPYRFVRHPMYVGILLMSLGMPLLLGSRWAVIPGVLNIILFIIRTALEDKALQAELPGYEEYARKVRYRLIPGVW